MALYSNKSDFINAVDNNIKTSAGQDKTTGSKLRQVFVNTADIIYNIIGRFNPSNNDQFEINQQLRTPSIQTDDPDEGDQPVSYKFGDRFNPEFAVNIAEDKVIQIEVDGVTEYVPLLEIATSIDPEGEFNGVRSIDTDYSIQGGDELILADCSNGDIEVELRDPVTSRSRPVKVKKVDQTANKVTFVNPNGIIEFGINIDMTERGEVRTFRHDGQDYYVI